MRRTFDDIGLLPVAGLGLFWWGFPELEFAEGLGSRRDGFLGRGDLDGGLVICWGRRSRVSMGRVVTVVRVVIVVQGAGSRRVGAAIPLRESIVAISG